MRPNRISRRQAAIISAFSGRIICTVEDLKAYADEKLGPEIGLSRAITSGMLHKAAREDWEAIRPAWDGPGVAHEA